MDAQVKADLLKLLGKDDLADDFEAQIDGTNRTITQEGMVAREATSTAVVEEAEEVIEETEMAEREASEEVVEEVVEEEETDEIEETSEVEEAEEEAEEDVEFIIDDSVIEQLADRLEDFNRERSTTEVLQEVVVQLAELKNRLAQNIAHQNGQEKKFNERLTRLEQPIEQTRQDWLADLPRQKRGSAKKIVYRPSVGRSAAQEPDKMDMANAAASVTDKWQGSK